MEALRIHTTIATNMVEYWNKYRLDYLKDVKMLALIDNEIEKYEAQKDHLLALRSEIVCARIAAYHYLDDIAE